jgi:HAD superfamily hydrolase (TIGR01509 family)
MTDAPLVVFDIGSTLVEGPQRGPAAEIAARLGLAAPARRRLSAALMTRDFGTAAAVGDFVRGLAGRTDRPVEAIVAEVWAAQEVGARPVDGAAEALLRVARQGVRFAVISNIWEPYLRAAHRHFGAFLDDVVPAALRLYSFQQGTAKPSPEMFERALRAARVPPERCVMVGDSYREDIEPAATLGMGTVWLLHRPAKEAANVARVRDHDAPWPSRMLGSINELDGEVISSLMARRAPAMEGDMSRGRGRESTTKEGA